MDSRANNIAKIIASSPWRNSYWFARMLLSGDKYGGVGKSKERQMVDLVNQLEVLLTQQSLLIPEKLKVCRDTLTKTITDLYKPTAKNYSLSWNLASDLETEIQSIDDIVVFIVAVKYLIAPMNAAIALVPSSDVSFCRATAKQILDSLGETAIGKVVSTWDDLGVKGCLDIERSLVVSEFTKLRANLNALDAKLSESEDNIVLSAL